MSVPFFQIDSFASKAFTGNPAAVCLLELPASDEWLQSVAMEMNLSETAFVWREDDGFRLRWFTPAVEVDLCGHATLAAAQALWESGWLKESEPARFHTRSGLLVAEIGRGQILLDFPALPAVEKELESEVIDSLNVVPIWFGKNRFDLLIEVATAREVYECDPDFIRLGKSTERGVILTARSDREDCDFVSRFFGPACGIDEDPVTGSAHVCLSPYWSDKLGRVDLMGFQASQRGGFVSTRLVDDRVTLGGQAITVLRGELLGLPSL